MTGYLARIQAAVEAGVFPAGEAVTVHVEHGPGCSANRGAPCVCHPLITATTSDEALVIGTGGAVLERRRKS